jgi:NADH-ubiquinone oxidoreductase chain 4L
MNLSLILFLIGILGFVLNRKNIILMLISIEIMLLAVTIIFALSSFKFDDILGQTFSIYIIAIAGAESAIGLGLLVAYYVRGLTFFHRGFTRIQSILPFLIAASELGEGENPDLNKASPPEAIVGLNLLSTEFDRKLFLLLLCQEEHPFWTVDSVIGLAKAVLLEVHSPLASSHGLSPRRNGTCGILARLCSGWAREEILKGCEIITMKVKSFVLPKEGVRMKGFTSIAQRNTKPQIALLRNAGLPKGSDPYGNGTIVNPGDFLIHIFLPSHIGENTRDRIAAREVKRRNYSTQCADNVTSKRLNHLHNLSGRIGKYGVIRENLYKQMKDVPF